MPGKQKSSRQYMSKRFLKKRTQVPFRVHMRVFASPNGVIPWIAGAYMIFRIVVRTKK